MCVDIIGWNTVYHYCFDKQETVEIRISDHKCNVERGEDPWIVNVNADGKCGIGFVASWVDKF